MSETVNDTRSF